MPFKSKAQQRYMFANHPAMAREFAEHTDFKKLPERAKGKPSGRRRRKKAEASEVASLAWLAAGRTRTKTAVMEDAPVPMSILPNPEAIDPTNALEDGPASPPGPVDAAAGAPPPAAPMPGDPMAAAGAPPAGAPPGGAPPAMLPPPATPQPVPMGAQPPPPPPQPPTMDQVLPGQIARQVVDPNSQQGAIAQAQMQPIPGAKMAAWRMARIRTLVKRAIALDTVPGGDVAHAMNQLRTAATPDGAGVQPGANMGAPAGPKRPMFNNWSAVAGAAPVANSTLKRVSPTTSLQTATPGLKSASVRDAIRAASRLGWMATGAVPGAVLGGLAGDKVNEGLGGDPSIVPGMAGMTLGAAGGALAGNKAWEYTFDAPEEKETRRKIAACCTAARKVVRPEHRKAGGKFAYRGTNAKSLRDDPEYDRYMRGGK